MTPQDRARHDANRAEALANQALVREQWVKDDAATAEAREKVEASFAAGLRAHDLMTGDVVEEPEAAPSATPWIDGPVVATSPEMPLTELPAEDRGPAWRQTLGVHGSVEEA
jgi:hypothetical protein